MGADANTKQIVCSRPAELLDSDIQITADLLEAEDSTLSISDAVKLLQTCSNFTSHDDDLKSFKEIGSKTPILPSEIGTDPNYKFTIVWSNLLGFIALHMIGFYSFYVGLSGRCSIWTTLYSAWLGYAAGQGITMGAHRHWSHRAFKAKRWLKIFLLYMHTMAGQNCLWVWVRDHRQHHKYSDTDADPHNANRGFWFSHVGWLCVRKHPKVIEYGKKINMSDIEEDPYIMFQKKYYKLLYVIFAFGLPTALPIYAWNEDPWMALLVGFFSRTIIQLNATWLVNSAAHLYGTRPYDETIYPVNSMFISAIATGEGWHNYHHCFPWDYRAAELGTPYNLTCKLIDFLANYGVIYDRREATATMIKNRCLRTGDKSHEQYGVPEAAPATKTLGGWWHDPMNPTYSSVQKPKVKMLPQFGYALVEEELSKRELDDDILSKENVILHKRMMADESGHKVNSSSKQLNYKVNLNSVDSNNNDEDEGSSLLVRRNKSILNIEGDENSCPGLAMSEVTYKMD